MLKPMDAAGNELAKGDVVMVRARIVDVVPAGEDFMLVAVTDTPHGEEDKRYGLPTLHGSQVLKVEP
jgi:hypothetical protein